MLTLWGNADSVNVQKVMWCCEEAGVAYQRIDAGRHFGVVDTPEFRALNPNGLVPVINDGGLVVWESNTIVRYLAARYASGTLWPEDPALRSHADRWMDWTNSTLWPALVPLFRAYMRTPPEQRDAKATEAARLESLAALTLLDQALLGREYVAGAHFTMGDIALGCAVWRWFALPVERPTLARLESWFGRLAQRPACRKVVTLPLSR
ncbi:glutathione S-transferase family protein [Ideonella sp. BN130291]|uniref:glutathione S-transferase family protein n=1 Tax=Ideonella sp. BN130291 TaxID=3112940 RepID=UPI002E26613B|nr:glutathione S-transferase family protein [Ideonella sp. BN130291]